jgi:hypothetical protein
MSGVRAGIPEGAMNQELPVAPDGSTSEEHTASHLLKALAAGGGGPSVTFGEVLTTAGARIHGLALLVLVLPETLPLPLPSASALLGVPLLLISLHLALFGEGSRWPERFNAIHVRRSAVAATARTLVPVLEWLETVSRPRLSAFVRHEQALGLVCVYLSLILLLPLPFVNAPPAISMAFIALGLIQRDGVLALFGLAGAAAITVALTWAGFWAGGLLIGSAAGG